MMQSLTGIEPIGAGPCDGSAAAVTERVCGENAAPVQRYGAEGSAGFNRNPDPAVVARFASAMEGAGTECVKPEIGRAHVPGAPCPVGTDGRAHTPDPPSLVGTDGRAHTPGAPTIRQDIGMVDGTRRVGDNAPYQPVVADKVQVEVGRAHTPGAPSPVDTDGRAHTPGAPSPVDTDGRAACPQAAESSIRKDIGMADGTRRVGDNAPYQPVVADKVQVEVGRAHTPGAPSTSDTASHISDTAPQIIAPAPLPIELPATPVVPPEVRSASPADIARMFVSAAEAVADAILVSSGFEKGEGRITVRLQPEVLSGSEVHITVKSGTMTVVVDPATQDVQALVEANRSRFEQHLAERVHSWRVAVAVKRGDRTDERA